MINFFSRNHKTQEKTASAVVAESAVTPPAVVVEPVLASPEEEWIWVEGYKGVTKDMKGRNDFEYILHKRYSMPKEEVRCCASGYHFSLTLNDVFKYYNVCKGHRFFKVQALVKKSDYEKYGGLLFKSTVYADKLASTDYFDKLAAASIVLTEEVGVDEIIEEFYKHRQGIPIKLPKEYNQKIIDLGYNEACYEYCTENLVNAGYSPAFSYWLARNGNVEKALALAAEPELSMDVKVLALMVK